MKKYNQFGRKAIVKSLLLLLLFTLGTNVMAQPDNSMKVSEWNGCKRYDFQVQGRDAIVVVPDSVAQGKPWIWRPAFFDAFPSVDKALLKRGWHIAYYDVTHLYGSPRSVALGNDFYHEMTSKWGLSPKVAVEGFSRGGYFAFNWGAVNPDKVACLYVDAPVCDIESWPGRKDKNLWNDFLREWNVKDNEVNADFSGNAMQTLARLNSARVPIIAVCGDKDTDVPMMENIKKVRDTYVKMGGLIELIVKPGCAHHPHSLENPEPIVDFIVRHQAGYDDYHHIYLRGSLDNAFLKFETEHKGVVAFLGGSITAMPGWHNMIMEDLKQRFPDTEFQFIEAGISSTGSTPHAFRFEHDVLGKGTPDLMFLEAAANDDTNHFGPKQQIRGMEGVVRHALTVNPKMDIIMMHFVHDPFIKEIQSGHCPDVIRNHEKVAQRYNLASINQAQEIAERMKDGGLTMAQWKGEHPSWYGSKFYAATVNRLFDESTHPQATMTTKDHVLPVAPLDSFSYTKGKFVDIREAKLGKGFSYVADWKPTDGIGTRDGFVHVPMLVATKQGSTLKLKFKGRAVGIFCVAGPNSAVLDYSIDGKKYKPLTTFTEWSKDLYLPWVYVFDAELSEGEHTLMLKTGKGQCEIRNFVVNE